MRIVTTFNVQQHGGRVVHSPTAASQVWPDGTDKVATFPDLHPGDVVFFANDLTTANQKQAILRQVDGNMARAIYGFANSRDLSAVAIHDIPRANYASQQGAVTCYVHPNSAGVDQKNAPFVYVALIGPVDDKHPAAIVVQEGEG